MNLIVSELEGRPVARQPVEVVERKGLGHPDTLCDALAEEVSLALSREYRERFGFVLHHNVDKVLLRGGAARPAFGGGEVDEPIELYIAGRATREYRGATVAVDELAVEACRAWLATHMPALDVERHVRVHSLIRPGSQDLVELFERQRRDGVPQLANDTSLGVGYAPLSPLERAVFAADMSLWSEAPPARGQDVKVMGVRSGEDVSLTVACAFIGAHLADRDAYLASRSDATRQVRRVATEALGREPDVAVNTADDPDADSLYLTVTGTSAEAGDDGQTGRGNRANGLITPSRPMTIESFAGKNPVTHVGKLYNVTATHIAEAIVAEIDEVSDAQVVLVSQIGMPVDQPQIADIRLRAESAEQAAALAPRAEAIARHHLARVGSLWEGLLSQNLATQSL
ncbi:S-adenosylmethionine synthetase [Thioalkalivibrio sp. ALE21]|uniref:methionine adenosyltransferase n=1 Tax=Thioalkalivibrio sp. ALE21 TaxID=1158175 RepID=UPI000D92451D|nr:methionine adenosyltransferase [Thioalkalivibrio sp. ALE21]PYG00382.1 S-adenosylmethionine synthetase [Thioalkalivibrio sp. ALE21]